MVLIAGCAGYCRMQGLRRNIKYTRSEEVRSSHLAPLKCINEWCLMIEGYQYCYFLRSTTRTEVVLLKVRPIQVKADDRKKNSHCELQHLHQPSNHLRHLVRGRESPVPGPDLELVLYLSLSGVFRLNWWIWIKMLNRISRILGLLLVQQMKGMMR